MTLFGWIFLILTVFGAIGAIAEIGRPRAPLTHGEATLKILCGALIFWGAYVWGVQA